MTQLVVWCWFSTTRGTDLTLVWPLSKPEGRGGRWELRPQLGLNLWGVRDLGSITIFYGCMLLGGGPSPCGYWLEELEKTINSHLLENHFQSHNCLAGVLVLVINYTGDRIHFGLATERARREGIKVD